MVLRGHLDIQAHANRGALLGHIERRPAPILFKPAGALLTCIVQKLVRDALPDCVGAVKADRVNRLDFHGAIAAPAGDAQYVALDFREMSLR